MSSKIGIALSLVIGITLSTYSNVYAKYNTNVSNRDFEEKKKEIKDLHIKWLDENTTFYLGGDIIVEAYVNGEKNENILWSIRELDGKTNVVNLDAVGSKAILYANNVGRAEIIASTSDNTDSMRHIVVDVKQYSNDDFNNDLISSNIIPVLSKNITSSQKSLQVEVDKNISTNEKIEKLDVYLKKLSKLGKLANESINLEHDEYEMHTITIDEINNIKLEIRLEKNDESYEQMREKLINIEKYNEENSTEDDNLGEEGNSNEDGNLGGEEGNSNGDGNLGDEEGNSNEDGNLGGEEGNSNEDGNLGGEGGNPNEDGNLGEEEGNSNEDGNLGGGEGNSNEDGNLGGGEGNSNEDSNLGGEDENSSEDENLDEEENNKFEDVFKVPKSEITQNLKNMIILDGYGNEENPVRIEVNRELASINKIHTMDEYLKKLIKFKNLKVIEKRETSEYSIYNIRVQDKILSQVLKINDNNDFYIEIIVDKNDKESYKPIIEMLNKLDSDIINDLDININENMNGNINYITGKNDKYEVEEIRNIILTSKIIKKDESVQKEEQLIVTKNSSEDKIIKSNYIIEGSKKKNEIEALLDTAMILLIVFGVGILSIKKIFKRK
ncbi:hypothetical protein [Clostridium ihumii]|uniref:hypothetical protein n=1 Tax=Clostridium ihumii TaxID=1470356 RepID=UPI003D344DD9